MNNLIKDALRIPVNTPVQTISVSPVVLNVEGRPIPLELRITAPVTGDNSPVILLSHGHGPSLYLPSKDGHGPLVNFYAEHDFVVIQPTHMNSKVAGMPADAAGGPLFWRSRSVAPSGAAPGVKELECCGNAAGTTVSDARPDSIAGRPLSQTGGTGQAPGQGRIRCKDFKLMASPRPNSGSQSIDNSVPAWLSAKLTRSGALMQQRPDVAQRGSAKHEGHFVGCSGDHRGYTGQRSGHTHF
jgi:hypothetical protein